MPYINVDEAYILDNTGLQVDQVADIPYTDAALTDTQKAQARKNIAAGGTNPNLLDNPFFQVNQRSAVSITGSSSGTPSVDRWLLFGSGSTTDLTVTANGVSVHSATNGFAQRMPSDLGDFLDGKTVTLSVMDTSGEVASGSLVYDKTTLKNTGQLTIGSYTCAIYAGKSGNFQLVSITTGANTIPLRAAKLELGTVSTLANDTPPNYADELLKCNRARWQSNGTYICLASAVSTTQAIAVINLPTQMFNTPSVVRSGAFALSDRVNAGIAVTDITTMTADKQTLALLITASGLTNNRTYALTTSDGWIAASADL